MDAVEFYKSMKRMCYSGEMCEKCPLYNNFSEIGSVCDVENYKKLLTNKLGCGIIYSQERT